MELLRIEDLTFTYALGDIPALSGVSLSVDEGEFVLLCGKSGCGKSTLLKSLVPSLRPAGRWGGNVWFEGRPLTALSEGEASSAIGFVTQNPDAQIVTDKVWHELAFGLENMGVPADEIRSRVAEMASYFGIHTWFRKKTSELSGGQKQLLNLAAVMLMNPRLLLLDEPTAQLDPIASREFIDTLVRINRELGVTILLAEHNLEEAYGLAAKVALMEQGSLAAVKPPRDMARYLFGNAREGMFRALPAAAVIASEAGETGCLPLSVVEGRAWMSRRAPMAPVLFPEPPPLPSGENPALELREVWFSYQKGAEPVLRNLSLRVFTGESFAILGGNGAGKTTALSVLSGRLRPLDGRALVNGRDIAKVKSADLFFQNLGVLPQNPQSLFVFETLRRDLAEALFDRKLTEAQKARRVEGTAASLGVTHLLERHPYDLSGGEMQKAALAKLLLREPSILLLDEPTKGLDALSKRMLGSLLRELQHRGLTLLMVTHDVEFAAVYADRCAMFFDGMLTCVSPSREFFSKNRFYTTAASRITRHVAQGVITCGEAVNLCRERTSV